MLESEASLSVVRLADYQPPPFLVDAVNLVFELDPVNTRVTAQLSLKRNTTFSPTPSSLHLDGEGLALQNIRLDGQELTSDRYVVTEDSLVVDDVPDEFELTVTNTICPAENKALEGLYLTNGRFCTQCEAEGFRRITYFPDRPDVLSQFTVEIRADKNQYPVLLSNGNRVAEGMLDGERHYSVWEDPFKKPCYLFAVVAGDLDRIEDTFTTQSDKKVALSLYVEHGKAERAWYAMESLKRAMAWDEKVYGLEYDLNEYNIVAVSDFNMGAMENKALNIFNDKFILADSQTATDTDFAWIEAVVAHEYFHNWTGNRITCRDWFQLSLKEGLTVFREQQFSADMRSASVKRIEDVRLLWTSQFPEDDGPLAHPVRPDSYSEINNFYTHTVYEKGAELVRMVYTLLGPGAYFDGMRLYVDRHDGQAVTCEDFILAMSDASGVPLDQFMNWYRQAGTPVIEVKGRIDAESNAYVVHVSQAHKKSKSSDGPTPFVIPLRIGFTDAEHGPVETSRTDEDAPPSLDHLIVLDRESQEFRFNGPFDNTSHPVLSLNRGFTAPVNVLMETSVNDLKVLALEDMDSFTRWQAVQELVLRYATKTLGDGNGNRELEAYLNLIEQLLAGDTTDPAETAMMLTVPNEAIISERLENFDPVSVYTLRRDLIRKIAARYTEALHQLYDKQYVTGAYQPIALDAGKRSLCNTALLYLAESQSEAGIDLAHQHYEKATNMTDRWAALVALNGSSGPQRQLAMADFFERHENDPLTLDKWFALEATCTTGDSLERVSSLLNHERYDRSNPNRIRAVVGNFAASNTNGFHGKDGHGYKFLADQVLDLDTFNPQVAARLAGNFQKWRRYDPQRQSLIETQLRRLERQTSLSTDVREIVAKSLGES